MTKPILYTFRRCPYAIRARMALYYSQISVEKVEVDLKNKPQNMLLASAKGTVPVLILNDGRVIDESIDIMYWALNQFDPDEWYKAEFNRQTHEIIQSNDIEFKPILDKYKYIQNDEHLDREYYRNKSTGYLDHLNSLLTQNAYLLSNQITLVDVAVFPFIRQFYMVDQDWFEQSEYTYLYAWLNSFLNSELFQSVMQKTK